MARYNEILVGRFNRYLSKVFSMKGEAPAPQVAGEWQPSLTILTGAESLVHQGWNLYGAFSSVGAVAVQFGAIQLRNPATSGAVAVFYKLGFTNTVGAADQPYMQVGARATDLTTVNALTLARFDPRNNAQSVLVASSQNNAAQQTLGATATKFQAALALNATIEVINQDLQEIPLLPGDVLLLSANVVNQALNAYFWWRERPLEESERIA